MKTAGNIRQKLKQLRFRYMKEYLEKNLKRIPGNCRYNKEHHLSPKKIGLCNFTPEKSGTWGIIVCDGETEEGLEQARGCPAFMPKRGPEELKEEFDNLLSTSSLGQIAYHYRDMAALMWVLEITGESNWNLFEEETEEVEDGRGEDISGGEESSPSRNNQVGGR